MKFEQKFNDILEILEEGYKKTPKKIAISCFGTNMTYQKLYIEAKRLAVNLCKLGLQVGDRIAMVGYNVLAYPVVIFGVLRAGCVLVNINPLYTSKEIVGLLKDVQCSAIIMISSFMKSYEEIKKQIQIPHVICFSLGSYCGIKGYFINFYAKYIAKKVPYSNLTNFTRLDSITCSEIDNSYLPKRQQINGSSLALIQFTGGTTGTAKGAMLTHHNVASNISQLLFLVKPIMSIIKEIEFKSLIALPLFHVFGFCFALMFTLSLQGQAILIPNPRDRNSIISAFKKYDPHFFPSISTLCSYLLQEKSFRNLDFKNLILCVTGGSELDQKVADEWFKVTKKRICEGYGLSETSPVLCCAPLKLENGEVTTISDTTGLPLVGTTIKILDDDEKELGTNEKGQICVSGPQVMRGYWNVEDNDQFFTNDNFFMTGDIGFIDERGYLKLVGRKKELIIVSGFNVYPIEVEKAVLEIPGVAECAAVGVPNENTGERVKVFVVPSDKNLTENIIKENLVKSLAAYKRPKEIEFCGSLPKNQIGKILRRELKALNKN